MIQDRQSGRSEVGRICYRQLLARQLGVKRHLSLPARLHFHTVHNHDDHGDDDDDDSTNDVDDVDEVSHSRQGGWDGAKSAVLAAPTHAPLYHLHNSTSWASLLFHLMRGLRTTEKRRVISCTSLCVS